MIFFLEKFRKLVKSLGKLEFRIIDKITVTQNLKQKKLNNYFLNNKIFEKVDEKIHKKENNPKKLVIVVCFFFNQKKIKTFEKTLINLDLLNLNKNITIITNELNSFQKKILNKLIKKRVKKISLVEINNLPDNNLLPWCSVNIMKKKFKDKSNSHFLFIEDDIIITKKNINYWIYFRKILRRYALIPSFIRYEIFKKKKFSVDNPKVINLNKSPNLLTKNKKNGFINSKFPYHAMYLMDRELMGRYLSSAAINIDFSFNNNFMKNTYPIKELANISHSYINIPKGYHNNLVIPLLESKIPNFCLIQHNETKYVKLNKLTNSGYGTIDIDKLIIS